MIMMARGRSGRVVPRGLGSKLELGIKSSSSPKVPTVTHRASTSRSAGPPTRRAAPGAHTGPAFAPHLRRGASTEGAASSRRSQCPSMRINFEQPPRRGGLPPELEARGSWRARAAELTSGCRARISGLRPRRGLGPPAHLGSRLLRDVRPTSAVSDTVAGARAGRCLGAARRAHPSRPGTATRHPGANRGPAIYPLTPLSVQQRRPASTVRHGHGRLERVASTRSGATSTGPGCAA